MKVLATPRSFATYGDELIEKMKENGIELILNTKGDIYTEEELKDLIVDLDGIIIGVDPLPESVLEKAPKLAIVSKFGVGLDNIDLDYCKKTTLK